MQRPKKGRTYKYKKMVAKSIGVDQCDAMRMAAFNPRVCIQPLARVYRQKVDSVHVVALLLVARELGSDLPEGARRH